ncbi:MAG TPA: STAS domain-containing protein [Polyangiaceae bacterium]|nr:STAS domain-containing protein [Polyangiaceae bacterium]
MRSTSPATETPLAVLDALKDPVAALGPDFEIRHINEAWRERFGAAPGGDPGFARGKSYLDCDHPVLGPGSLDKDLLEAALGGAHRERESRRDADGGPRWIVTSAGSVAVAGERVILVQKRDITSAKREEAELSRYRGMLESLGFAIACFLAGSTWRESAQRVIARFGEVLDVSRVYVFETRADAHGKPLAYQRYEWTAPGVRPELNNEDMQGGDFDEMGLGRLRETYERNEPFGGVVSSMLESERAFFESQDIKALWTAPIFVEDAWWGFIGFDECRTERVFTAAEIEGLRAAAGLFGSAIQHQRLREAETRRVAQEEILKAQEAALLELSTPLLPVREDVLVMPLVGSMDAKRAGRVLEVVLRGIVERRARVAILDITGVPAMDSIVADAIVRVAKGARLLGAQVILTGIGPEVARTLVEIGAELGEMTTASSLQTAMELAIRSGSAR